MTESEYLTAVCLFTYFNPLRVKLLISHFASSKRIWLSKTSELMEIGISERRALEFDEVRKHLDIKSYFDRLKKLKIKVTTILDGNYPENLKDLVGSPSVLYFKGKLKPKDVNSVAIVGSRKMTAYGEEIAQMISTELARHGVTIISGLARGIDTVAHKGAIKEKGRTIAILGNGIDFIYPGENRYLADEILKGGGAIISEYPPGFPPLPANFVARNRIVSGMSTAVVVIEGAERSGTLTTASHAAEQGKTVFAVPGRITSPTSFVPHLLIKNGAQLVTSAQDILDELKITT